MAAIVSKRKVWRIVRKYMLEFWEKIHCEVPNMQHPALPPKDVHLSLLTGSTS